MLSKVKLLICEKIDGNVDVFDIIFNSKNNKILDFSDFITIDDLFFALKQDNYIFNGLNLNYNEFRDEIEKLGFNTILEGLDSFCKYHDDFISQVKSFRQSDDIIKDKLLNQLKEIIQNTKELKKYPNLNTIIRNKDRDQIQSWMKNAIQITLDNANTMNYVNKFISYGLNHNELLLCDSRISL